MLSHEFFHIPAPKTTGREDFNMDWLSNLLSQSGTKLNPQDVQATLMELSALSITDSLKSISKTTPDELFICGGGAHNTALLERISHHLPTTMVCTTEALGLSPDWVEAVAFAWLAKRTINKLTGSLPDVTGANQAAILGGVYFAD